MEGAVARADRERPIGFIGLMRNRNYALLWWGQLVSEVGNRFHWVAVSLWVYSVTGSAGSVSLAVASMFVGSLLVGPWAGVLVDRWDRRKILVASDLVRGVLVALIPPLMSINVWLVYADLILISVATAFFRPAIFAIIPATVNQRHLLPANSFFSAMDSGTEIFGPALAGLLAFKYGYAPLVYFDAATYLISAICMALLTVPGFAEATGFATHRSVASELMEGFRYIRRDVLQWQLFLMIFPAYLVGSGLNSLQTPLAKGEIGISDAEFGTFQGLWGVGLLVGSLFLAWFGGAVPKSMYLVGGFILQFGAAAGMALSKSFSSLAASAFGVGFGNTLGVISLMTILMEATPKQMLGRVVSVRQMALASVRIVTPLLFGVVGDFAGVRESVLVLVALGISGFLAVAFPGSALWKSDPVRGIPDTAGHGLQREVAAGRALGIREDGCTVLNALAILLASVGLGGLAYVSLPNAVGFGIAILLCIGCGGVLRAGASVWRPISANTRSPKDYKAQSGRRGTERLVESHSSRADG
ncbi:MAG: MFS transporter [Armatimonadota bacterium]|nr:MFS transporter [Armatimonadota bacterium]MDR7560330.1 MFS transporter [Armatimonadota bacterium]MDR7588293.1 MFS transporter [Armatimonadota bacterium]MDR7611917.1 MFS transporter [Armatimonadota bacterium]